MTSESPSRRARSSRSSGVMSRNVSRADFGCMSTTLAEPVLPAFPPGEILLDEIFQRAAADVMVQAPPGGDVADDQDPFPVPAAAGGHQAAGTPVARRAGRAAGQPADR